jgi:hypothetical protein
MTVMRDFLSAVFADCTGLLELRALPSRDRVFTEPSNVAAVDAFAAEHHTDDVYFGVAARQDHTSGALSNCRRRGALFVDLDCADDRALTQAREPLATFLFPPSITIMSGGGLHAY